jgi:L-ribulose-5-phosphate 3-epimerase
MYLGYNTNGLAHHDLFDAVELLAEIGYRGVAITIDHNALPPCAAAGLTSNAGQVVPGATAGLASSVGQVARLRRLLDKLRLRSVIETGTRFLLDPRHKHEPTLLSEDRRRRIDFYRYAIDCAAELGSDCVSLWSGTLAAPLECGDLSPHSAEPPEIPRAVAARGKSGDESPHSKKPMASLTMPPAIDRLIDGLREVLDYAAAKDVSIGFEPEPGMLIDTMRAFDELLTRIDAPNLRLTLDIGHLHCQGETPIANVIRRWAPRLANVHIEDMRAGRHEHLMFGEGEIDFPPVLQALREVGYADGVYVELSRHSHEGPAAAKKAFEFLEPMMGR